ncbi:MAG: hypothetical protein ACHREM_16985 [Polyangiales bacterium]
MIRSAKLHHSLFALASAFAFASVLSACGPKKHARVAADDDDDDAPKRGHAVSKHGGEDSGDAREQFRVGAKVVHDTMSKQDHGVGLIATYLVEKTEARTNFVYHSDTPPVWVEDATSWVVVSQGTDEKEVTNSILVLGLPQLKPGHYEGSDSRHEATLAASIGETKFEPKGPETSWSSNGGSWCEIEVKSANSRGDLEGSFKGKLMSNSGDSYYLIEQGYFYVRR